MINCRIRRDKAACSGELNPQNRDWWFQDDDTCLIQKKSDTHSTLQAFREQGVAKAERKQNLETTVTLRTIEQKFVTIWLYSDATPSPPSRQKFRTGFTDITYRLYNLALTPYSRLRVDYNYNPPKKNIGQDDDAGV